MSRRLVNALDAAPPDDREARAREYRLTPAQVSWLAGVVTMAPDLRREVLAGWARKDGAEIVIEAFAEFVGLANSVVENISEWARVEGCISRELHPHGTLPNFPTIFGALMGVRLADGVDQSDPKMCEGCAYRLGTPANQSPITTCDAEFVQDEPGRFTCHMHEGRKPPCRGSLMKWKLRPYRRTKDPA